MDHTNEWKGESLQLNQDTIVFEEKNTETSEILIYVGPTIPNVISTNSIFNNGIPKQLQELISIKPYVSALLVPIEKLAQARVELRNPGSAFSVLYKKITVQ